MQLLLVEDELEIQDFLKTSLTDAGYEVDVAGDGNSGEVCVDQSLRRFDC